MVPTLVAHAVLGAHAHHTGWEDYHRWYQTSFKKCVVRVNQKEFDKIRALPRTFVGWENKTLDGKPSCAIPLPCENDVLPNVLKFAKLWAPKT